ncbi:hypothetical protein RND71_018504 [Anisodus tanguticus]|uniref:Uncharacterized protein n=1 Tax=Anisodus tanguticus TaxID=243964 RepID=A0AAE1VB27_9SOLA|nr:hypothetical protein RND71_018504 [Anisodus tanguticus]
MIKERPQLTLIEPNSKKEIEGSRSISIYTLLEDKGNRLTDKDACRQILPE